MSRFLTYPFLRCNIEYSISYLFLLFGNIFLYFVVIQNAFSIPLKKNETTLKFIFFIFGELIILLISRLICISRKDNVNETLLPKDNKNNNLQYI